MKFLVKVLLRTLSPEKLNSLKHLSFRFISYLNKITPHISLDASLTNGVKFDEIQKSTTIFALDTNSDVIVADIETNQPLSITWGHSDTTYNKYLGVLLRENQFLELGSPISFKNSWLRLSFAPAFRTNQTPNATLNLQFLDENRRVYEICCFCILDNQTSAEWCTFEIDLQNFEGRTGLLRLELITNSSVKSAITSAANDHPLVISKFTIAPKSQLALTEARTFQEIRVANEVGHFSEVYEHEMYKSEQYENQPIQIVRLDEFQGVETMKPSPSLQTSSPLLSESVYAYATRLLCENLSLHDIDFSKRIMALSRQKPSLRILSICSGSARTEAAFDILTGHTLQWTLQDLNEDLLDKARKQFSPLSSIEFIVGDVNKIQKTGRRWDVIMCVSGLHHVVELEKVVKFISESLTPGGEFWLIGEYVGRSGNRLYPEAQIAADKIFNSLPSKYRFNHHTKEVDSFIPKNDYSIDCFEGIRAEEIEATISQMFYPKLISRNNSFLWRLVNLAYADNYDLKDSDDLSVIESLVEAEIAYFKNYQGGTTLNAVYNKISLEEF